MGMLHKGLEGRIADILDALQVIESTTKKRMVEAYDWYLGTKKPLGSEFHIGAPSQFEVLLQGKDIVETTVEQTRRLYSTPGLKGFPACAANLNISPQFSSMFQAIPKAYQKDVIEKLKLLASASVHRNKSPEENALKLRYKHHMPCVGLGPGISVVMEPQRVGGTACLLGFLIEAVEVQKRTGDSTMGVRSSTMGRKVVLTLWVASLLLLITVLVYVPYEVIFTRSGDNLRAFIGYDFIWSMPDISPSCDLYKGTIHNTKSYSIDNRCYSAIDTSRIFLSGIAAFALLAVTSMAVFLTTPRRPS